jgi:hypothetical protein
MFIRQTLVIGLFASAAILGLAPAHAAGEAKKDPKTGKNCVVFLSSERTTSGLTRMNYRNTCASPFEIRITAGENLRKTTIEAGTPQKPALGYVICQPDDRCEVARWEFE